MSAKIAVVANTAWYIANFRSSLIRGLVAAGYEVVSAAPPDEYVRRVEESGARFVPLPMDNKGTNPIRDFWLFLRFVRLFWRERPKVFLGYTVKPNVYGGLAARLLGIPAINNVAGLGTAFIRVGWLTRVVEFLYRVGLANAHKIFFQNDDDLGLFVQRGLVKPGVVERLPGSGVDTQRFSPVVREDLRPSAPAFRFLLYGRLLWDKGVGEFVEAARKLRVDGTKAEFQLLGFLDVANRAAIVRSQVQAWEREGIIRYLGTAEDVRPLVAQADCVVLPSYREGVPRSLLEAASMAKPLVTTDATGCRDAVENGVTGFLCRVRDAEDLADKMRRMLDLPEQERLFMGLRGREKMVREFDERIVIDRYLEVVAEL